MLPPRKQLRIICRMEQKLICRTTAYNTYSVINTGADKIIFFLHTACNYPCFNHLPFSV